MRAFDTGNEKVKKICDALVEDTLAPAKQEAMEIVKQAKQEAKRIVEEAQAESKRLVDDARAKNEQERAVFDTSVRLAAKQAVSSLEQEISSSLFKSGGKKLVESSFGSAEVAAKLVDALLAVIEKEGLSGSIVARLADGISKEDVAKLILHGAKERLTLENGVQIRAGVQLVLKDEMMTLDVSGDAIAALLGEFIREEFRDILFAE